MTNSEGPPPLEQARTYAQRLKIHDPTEDAFMVRNREWNSYCIRLRQMPLDPIENASTWAAACFGVGVGTGVALITVFLAQADRSPWLVATLTVLAIAALLMMIFFMVTAGRSRKARAGHLNGIVTEMEQFAESRRVSN